MRRVLSLLLLATAVAGCGSKTPEPAKVPLGQAPAAAPAASDLLTGKVLEHLDASPYLYLRIATTKGDVWAAVPEAKIENGAEVTVFGPMLMTNFESKTLKRSFKEVYFGTLTPATTAADAPGPRRPGHPAPIPMRAWRSRRRRSRVGKVEKATGADARTVAEAWAQKASLEGKTITIRGKVVKFNRGVMGKNWLHLRDGSGDAAKGTNDITVTTLDEAAVGTDGHHQGNRARRTRISAPATATRSSSRTRRSLLISRTSVPRFR